MSERLVRSGSGVCVLAAGVRASRVFCRRKPAALRDDCLSWSLSWAGSRSLVERSDKLLAARLAAAFSSRSLGSARCGGQRCCDHGPGRVGCRRLGFRTARAAGCDSGAEVRRTGWLDSSSARVGPGQRTGAAVAGFRKRLQTWAELGEHRRPDRPGAPDRRPTAHAMAAIAGVQADLGLRDPSSRPLGSRCLRRFWLRRAGMLSLTQRGETGRAPAPPSAGIAAGAARGDQHLLRHHLGVGGGALKPACPHCAQAPPETPNKESQQPARYRQSTHSEFQQIGILSPCQAAAASLGELSASARPADHGNIRKIDLGNNVDCKPG